jgi:hypothetical protein
MIGRLIAVALLAVALFPPRRQPGHAKPCIGLMLITCLLGTIIAIAVMTSPVSASCANKNSQIDQTIARLVDLSSTLDPNQQARDKEAIRSLTQRIGDEDCLGATAEMQRLYFVLLGVRNNIDVLSDYGRSDAEARERYLFLTPIQIQVYLANDSSHDATCRCYARRSAVLAIFSEMVSMLDTYATPKPMTAREYRAVFAWYKVLDRYLSDVIGVHVANAKQISSVDIRRLQMVATAELKKHCRLPLYGKASEPADGECKYRASTRSTPSASPSPGI